MRYSEKWPEYASQWDKMVIKKGREAEFKQCAEFAIANKPRYLTAAARVRAHWAHIAVIHRRESDQDKHGNPRFDTYLGNGQPLNKRTTIVPKGRGPFASFEDGAADAWHVDKLDDVKDWRLEKMLYWSEVLNGAGYHNKRKPSPYLWGGTNIQVIGKFVADGRWSGTTWDKQPGVAPMLWMIAQLDKSVEFVRED